MNTKYHSLILFLFIAFGMKAEIPFAIYNEEDASMLFLCSDSLPDRYENIEGMLAWQLDLNQGSNLPVWHDTKASDATKVEFDESFKDVRATSCFCWFDGFANLTSITGLEYLNTSCVTDMSGMFKGCANLSELSLTYFNTSRATDMQDMFAGCTNLKKLDISTFNTASVTDMAGMFSGCSSISTIYVCDKFMTESISSSADMFEGCSNLKNFDSSSTDKTHAAKGDESYLTFLMKYPYAFYYPSDSELHFMCFNTKMSISGSLDIVAPRAKSKNIWDVDLDQNDNYPSWTNTHASDAIKIIIEPSFNTVCPNSIANWFEGFKNLQIIEGLENLDTSSVKNMSNAFTGCSDLKSLTMSNFNMINVTNVEDMFSGCETLRLVDLSQAASDCAKIIDQLSEAILVYVPNSTNISYGRKNVVVGDKCEHFVINYGANRETPNTQIMLSVPYSFIADKVTINIPLSKDTPYPMCLPFSMPMADIGSFFTYSKYEENEEMAVFESLSEESDYSYSNTPFMLIPDTDFIDGIELDGGIQIAETVSDIKADGFIGVYENLSFSETNDLENTCYVWDGSFFRKAEEGDQTVACSAYIKLPENASANSPECIYVKFEDNSTSGINSIQGNKFDTGAQTFDLYGRRINELFKGVLIRNGKKIMKF